MKIITAVSLLAALFMAACEEYTGKQIVKRFDYDLRGEWVTNDIGARYKGGLKIDDDRITITGYSEDQTPPPPPANNGNDSERPFRDFPKGVALKGYSEEGKIFIEYGGTVREGIPYTYDEDDDHYPPQYKIIRLNFGGRTQILESQ